MPNFIEVRSRNGMSHVAISQIARIKATLIREATYDYEVILVDGTALDISEFAYNRLLRSDEEWLILGDSIPGGEIVSSEKVYAVRCADVYAMSDAESEDDPNSLFTVLHVRNLAEPIRIRYASGSASSYIEDALGILFV